MRKHHGYLEVILLNCMQIHQKTWLHPRNTDTSEVPDSGPEKKGLRKNLVKLASDSELKQNQGLGGVAQW